MLEGLKKWWKEATSSHPAGTGRIGFIRCQWTKDDCSSSCLLGDKKHYDIFKALELERLGRMSKMMILDEFAEGHELWAPTDKVEWVDSSDLPSESVR